MTDHCFSISCDKAKNRDGRDIQINADLTCLQAKHPIVQSIGDFVNKYDPTSESCKLDENGIAAFDFTDSECLEITVGQSEAENSPNSAEYDEIIYTVTYEKRVADDLVAQYDLEQVLIAYAVECKGDRSREVDAIGVSLEGSDVPDLEDTVESPIANMPGMTVDGAQFNPNAVFPPGKTMKLDFSNVFENLGQYRIDICQSNGAPFVTKGCLEENWDQLGFDIDDKSMQITIAPVLAVNSKNLMEISCEVIFCKSCQGISIDCDKVNSDEDYYTSFIAIATRSQRRQERTLTQEFLVQPFEDPVLIKFNNVQMLVERERILGTELEHSMVTNGAKEVAIENELLSFILFLFMIFFK